MASSAIYTWASRAVFTLYDALGNLTNNSVTLQITQADPSRTLSPIDMTNSESNGFAEWAPGITMSEVDIAGILDIGLSFINLVFLSAMDNKFTALLQLYFVKPTVGAGANNPVILASKVIVMDAKIQDEVSQNGNVWKFTGKVRVIGKFTLTGTDVTGLTGLVQN